jgi:hypothetical protein
MSHHHHHHSEATTSSVDFSLHTPIGSLDVSQSTDGSHHVTSCLGIPHVFQDCGTLSTDAGGHQFYTDSTQVGPWTFSQTIPLP